MRGVSLDVADWFGAEATTQQLEYLLDNKELFQQLLREQGVPFLLKFVVNLRSYGMATAEVWAPESDNVFINLLKILLDKKVDKLLEYAKNLTLVKDFEMFVPHFEPFMESRAPDQKESCRKALIAIFGELRRTEIPTDEAELAYVVVQLRQCLSLSLRSTAALVLLAYHWSTSPHEDTSWSPPLTWSSPAPLAEPFEAYLRARWGQALPKVLGLDPEHIAWWRAPPRPKGTKIDPQADAAVASTISVPAPKKTQPRVSHKQDPEVVQEEEEAGSWLPEQIRRGDSFEPFFKRGLLGGDFFGLFRLSPTESMDPKWELAEIALGPMMSGQLQQGKALTVEQTKLATWAYLWQHMCGLEMSHLQHYLHQELLWRWQEKRLGTHDVKGLQKWSVIVKRSAGAVWKLRGLRGSRGEARSAGEALLEPTLLAQLPWNLALLQNWLAAALTMLLKVERESLELRHWPMPREVEPAAREVLSLLRHAKERVLFSLCLYCKQVVNYPKPQDSNLPTLLMETGVLPSLPALKFVCSGEAEQVLQELKSLAWGRPGGSIKDMVTMNPQAYIVNPELEKIYVESHWHVRYWLDTFQEDPFAINLFRDFSFENTKAELSDGKPPPPKSDSSAESKTEAISPNIFNQEEKALYDLWYHPESNTRMIEHVPLDKRVGMVKEVFRRLVRFGWFSATALKPLSDACLKPEATRIAKELQHLNGRQLEMPINVQLALYATLYFRFLGSLYHIDKDSNLTEFGWLVRLSGELVEKEQVVRVALMAAMQLDRAPQLPHAHASPRSPSQLLEEVQQVAAKRGECSLKHLWEQLPQHWSEPVKEHPTPDYSAGVESLVRHFEARLGALLGGAARESVRVWGQGCVAYPSWQVVQYLVPGYLGAFTACASSPTATYNLAALLHQIIGNLERGFLLWSKEVIKRLKLDTEQLAELDYCHRQHKLDLDGKHAQDIMTLNTARMLQRRLNLLLYTYVGRHLNLKKVPGFVDVAARVKEWWGPIKGDWAGAELLVFKAWRTLAIDHTTDLLLACHQAWKIPEPIPYPREGPTVRQLYFLVCLMDRIACLMHMFFMLNGKHYEVTTKGEWRESLMEAVSELEMKTEEKEKNTDLSLTQKKNKKNNGKREFDGKVGLVHLRKQFRSFRSLVETIGGEHFFQPTWMEFEPPAIKIALEHFLSGTTEQRDRLEVLVGVWTGRTCSNIKCCKKEDDEGQFLQCSKCVEVNIPQISVFCSSRCEQEWWKKEHMAWHLEHDLGIN